MRYNFMRWCHHAAVACRLSLVSAAPLTPMSFLVHRAKLLIAMLFRSLVELCCAHISFSINRLSVHCLHTSPLLQDTSCKARIYTLLLDEVACIHVGICDSSLAGWFWIFWKWLMKRFVDCHGWLWVWIYLFDAFNQTVYVWDHTKHERGDDISMREEQYTTLWKK